MQHFTHPLSSQFVKFKPWFILKKIRKEIPIIAASFIMVLSFQALNVSAQIEIGGGDGGCISFSTFPVMTVNSGQQSFDLTFTAQSTTTPITATFSTNPALSWITMSTIAHSSSKEIHLKGNAPSTTKNLFYPATVQISNSCATVTLSFIITVQAAAITPVNGGILFVTPEGGGNYSGISWLNATNDLQAAINAAGPGVQVWVKKGTYQPIRRADALNNITLNDRNNAFVLKEGVKLFGGFAGNEGLLTLRNLNLAENATILSGDVGKLNDNSDNAYHVAISVSCTNASVLDGFTVKDGNANGSGSISVNSISVGQNLGGGIANLYSYPQLSNLTISTNSAVMAGGGIYNEISSPSYNYVRLISNKTDLGSGGGIYNDFSNSVMNNVSFRGNYAKSSGGAIFNGESKVVLTNVLMTGNAAGNAGGAVENFFSDFTLTNGTICGNYNLFGLGGIYNERTGKIVIRNSIIYGNKSHDISNYYIPTLLDISYSMYGDIAGNQSTTILNSNIGSTDPQFVNAPSATTAPFTGGDYHLQSTSPLINVGYNNYYMVGANPDLSALVTDLDGNPRRNGSRIDLGPYESPYALPVAIFNFTAEATGDKAKLKWSTASETNNKEFIISHAADGKSFTEIGKVAGSGNSGLQNDYVFYDENPFSGINFYRLDQMDYDGRITDAGIRTANFSSLQNGITIYPNPLRDILKVTFGVGHFSRIELTDVNGKILQNIQVGVGDTKQKIDMANLASGVYFVRLIGNERLESRKVVKE